MADITLTVNEVDQTGVTIGYGESAKYTNVTTSDTYYLPNDGRTFLEVYTVTGFELIMTAHGSRPCSSGNTHDQLYTVLNNTTRVIGTFDPNRFNQTVGDNVGAVKLTFNRNSKVTAFRLKN
jgi:hypothetical protein